MVKREFVLPIHTEATQLLVIMAIFGLTVLRGIYKRADNSYVKPKAHMCSGDQRLLTANSRTNLSYQWRKNGANITSATSKTYTATSAGKYIVKVTKITTGCSKISAATTINITCKNLNSSKSSTLNATTVRVYPNPSLKSFTLELNERGSYNVQVYDMMGRMIEEHKAVINKLSFGNELSEGAYLIKIISASGEVKTMKAIKAEK